MLKNKKAISGVVTTILLVLLALVAILIIWGVIQPFLKKSAGGLGDITECLEIDLEISGATADVNTVTVQNKGSTATSDLVFVVDGTVDDAVTGDKILEPLESTIYTLTNAPAGGADSAVEVAAVVETEDGSTKTCNPVKKEVP